MTSASALRLRPLTESDEADALAAHAELVADDFEFLLDLAAAPSWARYVQRQDEMARGVDLPADRVAAVFLAAEVDGRLVGRTSVRLALNDWLAEYGGHIGYAVRPMYRRRGYATEILRRSLDVAREHGLGRVMITCDEDNVASAAVIQRCGGVFERLSAAGAGALKRRFWIDLDAT